MEVGDRVRLEGVVIGTNHACNWVNIRVGSDVACVPMNECKKIAAEGSPAEQGDIQRLASFVIRAVKAVEMAAYPYDMPRSLDPMSAYNTLRAIRTEIESTNWIGGTDGES